MIDSAVPSISARDRRLMKWLGGLVGLFALGLLAAWIARTAGLVGDRQERTIVATLAIGFVASLVVLGIVIIAGRRKGDVASWGIDMSRLALVLADAARVARENGLPAIDERCLLVATLDDLGVRRALALAAVDLSSLHDMISPEPRQTLDDSTYRTPRLPARLDLTEGAVRLTRGAAMARGAHGPRPIDLLIAATVTDGEARRLVRTVLSGHDLEVAAGYVDDALREPADAAEGLTPLVLHDDDVTPMIVVRDLLTEILGISRAEANQLTMVVHQKKGAAVVGWFTQSIAEDYAAQLVKRAREAGYPLEATAGNGPDRVRIGAG